MEEAQVPACLLGTLVLVVPLPLGVLSYQVRCTGVFDNQSADTILFLPVEELMPRASTQHHVCDFRMLEFVFFSTCEEGVGGCLDIGSPELVNFHEEKSELLDWCLEYHLP